MLNRTTSSKTLGLFTLILSFGVMLGSCGDLLGSKDSSADTRAMEELFPGNDTVDPGNECNQKILNQFGLDVLGLGAERCGRLARDGQEACENTAANAGFKGLIDLIFYYEAHESDPSQDICGCKCAPTYPDIAESCQGKDDSPFEATEYNAFGQGTENNRYRVYTAEQLYSMSRNVGALENKHYELCADIDLQPFYGSTGDAFYFSIGSDSKAFEGSFEGNYKTIKNYRYQNSGPNFRDPVQQPIMALDHPTQVLRENINRIGLFGFAEKSQFKDITLLNSRLDLDDPDGSYTGTLIGDCENGCDISHVAAFSGEIKTNRYGTGGLIGGLDGDIQYSSARLKVIGSRRETGGLIAHLYKGTVLQSSSFGDVIGGREVGGLLGVSGGDNYVVAIIRSHASGNISGKTSIGGLIGIAHSEGKIEKSYATGDASGDVFVGGLIGMNFASLAESYATGSVSGASQVGGLIGLTQASANKIYATGDVSGNSEIGGLVGRADAPITESHATGSISGADVVGGLVGRANASLAKSYATGSISGANYVGGLVGRAYAPITESHATGSISGADFVGGLVGRAYASLAKSYATGSISGADFAGGLVGRADAPITESHATGSVSGASQVGGLIGWTQASANKIYATGAVSGANYVGGLIGVASGSVTKSYAVGRVSGTHVVGGLIGFYYGSNPSPEDISNNFVMRKSNPLGYAPGHVVGNSNTGILVGALNDPSSTVAFSNNHYRSDVICTGTPCDAGILGATGHVGEAYFYSSSNAPMNTWDFVNVWSIKEGQDLPYLDF